MFYQKLEEQQLKGPFVDSATIEDNSMAHSDPVLPKNMMESCMVVNLHAGSSKASDFPATQEEDEDGRHFFISN